MGGMYVEDNKRGESMNVLFEEDVRDLRLAEQGLMTQSLNVKTARIGELEAEVRYLRRLLNEMLAPKAQPLPRVSSVVPPRGPASRSSSAALEGLNACH